MFLARRAFIGFLAQAGILLSFARKPKARKPGEPLSSRTTLTFSAFLDTLIPEDTESPSASQVGIDELVLEEVSGRERWLAWIQSGCDWLDEQARLQGAPRFADMVANGRDSVLSQMAKADPASFERRFFENWRFHGMRLYYSHPSSWPSLAFRGPPQPEGYMDHAEPPREQ